SEQKRLREGLEKTISAAGERFPHREHSYRGGDLVIERRWRGELPRRLEAPAKRRQDAHLKRPTHVLLDVGLALDLDLLPFGCLHYERLLEGAAQRVGDRRHAALLHLPGGGPLVRELAVVVSFLVVGGEHDLDRHPQQVMRRDHVVTFPLGPVVFRAFFTVFSVGSFAFEAIFAASSSVTLVGLLNSLGFSTLVVVRSLRCAVTTAGGEITGAMSQAAISSS